MKKQRVLALMHESMVPPEDVTGVDFAIVDWKKTIGERTRTRAASEADRTDAPIARASPRRAAPARSANGSCTSGTRRSLPEKRSERSGSSAFPG